MPNDAIHLTRAIEAMHPVNNLGKSTCGQVIAGIGPTSRSKGNRCRQGSLVNSLMLKAMTIVCEAERQEECRIAQVLRSLCVN